MVLATKKNCQRVLAASLRVVSAMTGNPPLGGDLIIKITEVRFQEETQTELSSK